MNARRLPLILLLLGACFCAGACRPGPRAADGERPGETKPPLRLRLPPAEYPRVDGSTSTYPLSLYILHDVLGLEAVRVIVTGPVGMRKAVYTRAPDPGGQPIPEEALAAVSGLRHTGTHESYVNLIEGRADLALVARAPSRDEMNLAAERQTELEVTPVALDAFVFLVNDNNPIAGLSLDQIRDIYTGKVANWSEVGGAEAPLRPYQREPNSGSQELMLSLVMKDLEPVHAPEMIVMGMMGPFNRLKDDRGGIGYSVYYYDQAIAPDVGTKMIAVEGVDPTPESIRTRSYPLTSEVFAVIRADTGEEANARKLRDWLPSPGGQRVVVASGYQPVRRPQAR